MPSSRVPDLAPGPAAAASRPRGTLRGVPLRDRAAELFRFGSVGTAAFVVDMGVYNLLRFGPVGLLQEKPLTARVIAVVLATLVSWLGSRHWTFAGQRTHRQGRELLLFGVINVLGIGITVGTLAFSHYVLGYAGPFADNVANVVGIVLGTVVRYVGYKTFVFTGTATVPTALAEVGHRAREQGSTPEVRGVVPRPAADGDSRS
ncbi:GtrA family protein [Cellulosimicrobium cellulans]|uniref:GtrA family protein n=1 Tax=Cellulosimicrobium cellulans TaxID=1710 RepID=UPI0021CB78CD|nr:GtrA family protein [Cellulosimicrobium cellulans]